MTRHEFEELIGHKVEDSEYAFADFVYNNTEMNKQDFCAIWKATGDNKIYREMADTIRRTSNMLDVEKDKNKRASEILMSIIPAGIDLTPYDENVCEAIAVLTSHRDMIVFKLNKKIALAKNEIEYIIKCFH